MMRTKKQTSLKDITPLAAQDIEVVHAIPNFGTRIKKLHHDYKLMRVDGTSASQLSSHSRRIPLAAKPGTGAP